MRKEGERETNQRLASSSGIVDMYVPPVGPYAHEHIDDAAEQCFGAIVDLSTAGFNSHRCSPARRVSTKQRLAVSASTACSKRTIATSRSCKHTTTFSCKLSEGSSLQLDPPALQNPCLLQMLHRR